jgi:uncharacterized membrane protein
MKRTQALWLGALLVLAACAVSAWYYPHLPASVPTHWDLAGRPNNYSNRFWGAAQFPILMGALWLMLLVLPKIAPKGFRLDPFLDAFDAVLVGIIAACLVWNIIVLHAAANPGVWKNYPIYLPLGIIFIIVGNYMGKFRKNFFVGVRTPWTLASDEVWARTHRLAGRLFVIYGLIVIANALLGFGGIVVGVGALVIVVWLVIYSFVAYARIEGFGSKDVDEPTN